MPRGKLLTWRDAPLSNNQTVFLNFAIMNDGKWQICWETKYLGSERKEEAVKLRKEWLRILKKHNSKIWNERRVKTLKIDLF